MIARVHALLLLLCSLAAGNAVAEPRWKAAFPHAAVAQQLPGTDLDVLVSSADGDGARAAADALQKALAACKTVRRAAIAHAPATLKTDAARIAWTQRRAASEIIFYVQLEADADGQSAIVSIFDASGQPSGSFVASPTSPLLERASAAPAQGLSRSALSSVNAALETSRTRSATDTTADEPLRVIIPTDERGRLQPDDAYGATPDPEHPRRDFRQALPGEHLYEALGRNDLAERYRARGGTKRALVASGGATVGALGFAGLVTLAAGGIDQSIGSNGPHTRNLFIGGGATLGIAVGVGAALIVAGKVMRRTPVSDAQLARLVEKQHRTVDAQRAERTRVASGDQ